MEDNAKDQTQKPQESKDSSGRVGGSSRKKKDFTSKSTNEDVQRAIEGLKEIPDEELQEFLNDDFMEGLDVVDAWEGDEEKNRESEQTQPSHPKEKDRKQVSRDRHRRECKPPSNREKSKREDKKREEMRRDPNKSSKDIERDKMRAKRDTESKLLAEKERAIKNLLDSDNVVPPGTETEAIQCIAEKNLERAQLHSRRSRERKRSIDRQRSAVRRRSHDRGRIISPRRRSPFAFSPDRHRSPFKLSIERHRSPYRSSPKKRRSPLRSYNYEHRSSPLSPERRRSPLRRLSWERRTSIDKRWSADRHRRRVDVHERRRSRSRERHRSRSMERPRRRPTRSPIARRFTPRRWSRTRSRTRSRSRSKTRDHSRTRSRSIERRGRKRSPFINELARQLRNDAIATSPRPQYGSHQIETLPPLMNPPPVYQDTELIPPVAPSPFMHQLSVGPPISSGLPVNGGPAFMNFDVQPQGINFEPVTTHSASHSQTTYSCGPVLYSQNNERSGPPEPPPQRPALLPLPVPSPQPVPAPASVDRLQVSYNSTYSGSSCRRSPPRTFEPAKKPTNTGRSPLVDPRLSSQNYRNGYRDMQEERLKTPEPPVISDTKPFEKTSLSSLLEASVSGKDSVEPPVLYPGFRPEIIRHCEHALRELPVEDPRLMMKGRFFFDPEKEKTQNKQKEYVSNSILLQKTKNKIYWDEDDERNATSIKPTVQMHQKICQTDETDVDSKFVQAKPAVVDSEVQVYPHDLQETAKEEKRPIMDRLDWSARETFDYSADYREAGDLRWSLNSQRRSYNRSTPPKRSSSPEHNLDPMSSTDHDLRNTKLGSPVRNRSQFTGHKGQFRRYPSNYRENLDEQDDFSRDDFSHDEFHESRSDRSRAESPLLSENSWDELEVEPTFQRKSDWRGRGKSPRGRSSSFIKTHPVRGKYTGGRPYRGRSSFRGKY